jgi:hypothetical protein
MTKKKKERENNWKERGCNKKIELGKKWNERDCNKKMSHNHEK